MYREEPITDALVKQAATTGSILIAHECRRRGSRSHLKPHKDRAGRWYVRVGRRGGCKMYLTKAATLVEDGERVLTKFYIA